MVEFKVRADSLEDVAKLLQMVIASFDLHMSHVENRVHQVAGTSWRGDDAETFLEGWRVFEGASVDVRAALEGLAGSLRAAASTYNLTEAGIDASVKPTGGSK